MDRIANFSTFFFAVLIESNHNKIYNCFNFSVLFVVSFQNLIIYGIMIYAFIVFKVIKVSLSFNGCNCVFSSGKSVLALKNADICIEIFTVFIIEYGYGCIIGICSNNFDILNCSDSIVDICFPFGNLSFCFNKHIGSAGCCIEYKVGIMKHCKILSFRLVAVQFVPSCSCRYNHKSILIRLPLFGIDSIYGRSQLSIKIYSAVKVVLIVYFLIYTLSFLNVLVGN